MTDYTPNHTHEVRDEDVPGDLNLDEHLEPATVAAPIEGAHPKTNLPMVIATNVVTVDDRYDYTGVSPEIADAARKAARKIRNIKKVLRTGHLEIGRELMSIKARLAHGQFGPWLQAEFHMSERSAQNYMSAAEFVSRNATAAVLQPRALYLLAAPSTPDTVVTTVVAAIADKRIPSLDEVRLLIEKEKETAALEAEPKAVTEATRTEKGTPEDAERPNKPAQQEKTKRSKKADKNDAKCAAAQKAADDAVQLLVDRLGDLDLLTFCDWFRTAGHRFKEALESAEIDALDLAENASKPEAMAA